VNIYAVRQDNYKYRDLDLHVDDFIEAFPEKYTLQDCMRFSESNIALSSFWPAMQTEFLPGEEGGDLIPGITTWMNATLLLSPQAHRLLEDLMKPWGEFLPIVVSDQHYQIFNCLNMVDAVKEESVVNEKLVFTNKNIGESLLFKSPFQCCMDTYCTERFRQAVESFELNGLVFDTNLASPFA